MATHPTIMKLRLAAINRIISAIPVKPDTDYWLDSDEIQINRAESALANKIRNELNNLPKGYSKPVHSLKTQAKIKYLQWRENQAKGAWKNLPADRQAEWEGYITEGLEFAEIRERELAKPDKASDMAKMLRLQLDMLNGEWPAVAIPVQDLELLLDRLNELDG